MSPNVIKVTIASGGTAQQLIAASTPTCRVEVSPAKANVGRLYVGTSALNIGTGAGIIADLAAPGAGDTGQVDTWYIHVHTSNPIDLSDLWFDGSTNEIAFVTYWPM